MRASTRDSCLPVVLATILLVVFQGLAAASAVEVQHPATSHLTDLSKTQQQTQQQQQKQKPSHLEHASTTAAAAAAAESVLPGDPDPAGDTLIEWIRQNGGEVNVAIRRNVPGSGRGTFAPRALKKGDVLASIPVEMTYTLAPEDDSLAVSASFLMADMAEEDSPWKPYFESLPGPSDVWSSVNVPQSYMPIIQDQWTETAISQMQDNVRDLWDAYGDKYKKVLGDNVAASNITYGMGVLLTRLFRFDGVDVLLPILDMANHENECLHSHVPEPCDPVEGFKQWEGINPRPKLAATAGSGVYGPEAAAAAAAGGGAGGDGSSSSSNGTSNAEGAGGGVSSGQCLVWRAEEDVAPGGEVCNSYKTLFQDRALLQYGFLQRGAPVLEMNTLDRHDHIDDLEHVWADPPGSGNFHGPRRFEGTPAQIQAEISRLTARLKTLQDGEAAVAAIKPDPALDPDGSRLATMLEWRQQRKAAIVREIPRLRRQAARFEQAQNAWGSSKVAAAPAAAASSAGGASGLEAANSELLQWLEANGATVHVELKPVQPETTDSSQQQQQVCSNSDSDNMQSQSCAAPWESKGQASASSTSPVTTAAGVFTRIAVKRGEVLAVVPVELSYPVKPGPDKLESAVELMREIQQASQEKQADNADAETSATSSSSSNKHEQSSMWGPLVRSLPPLGSVHSLYNFPHEYLPALQQRRAAAHVRRLQRLLSEEYEAFRMALEARDNTTAFVELQHAASLIYPRPLMPVELPGGEAVELLLPLFTNARHNSRCPHDHYIEPCPPGTSTAKTTTTSGSGSKSSNLCFYWVAGVDLQKGDEVCVSYGYLRPDQALLMYGLSSTIPSTDTATNSSSSSSDGDESGPEMWLSGLDTMEADGDNPLGFVSGEPLQHWRPANREEALAESVWLVQLHRNLSDPAAAANITALKPAAWDADGAFLSQLLRWREQRIAAIEWELGRLSADWNITAGELAAAGDKVKLSEAGYGGASDASGSSGSDGVILMDFESESEDPWERMLAWMRHNGAVINVNVTYAGPQYGRVVVASDAATRGDILAAIPLDLVWSSVKSGGNGSMQLAAANLWADIDNPTSPFRPYFDALPSHDEILCPFVALSKEYYPVLQDDKAINFVEHYQGYIQEFWEQFGEDMSSKVPSLTLDNFKYARAVLSTRLFGMHEGTALIPLLDLANHAPYCTNVHVEQPCPQDPDRQCIVWTAGVFHARGAEVCNGYKWMANDRSALQYGFMQSGPIKDALHTVDHPNTTIENVFGLFDNEKYGPAPFDGTAEEIKSELARLQSILANVTSGDAAAAAVKPLASDKGGRLLTLLQGVRQQRKEALNKEIDRLQQRLAAVAEAAEKGGKAAADSAADVTPEERMLEWLQENGGQVNGLRLGSAAAAQPSTRHGVWTTQPIKRGSVLATIPLDLALPVNTNNLLIDAPMLVTELKQARSPRAPYYNTLPTPTEVFSYYEMPVEYAPIIQHAATAEFLATSNATLDEFLEDNPHQMEWRNMTIADLKHVFSLVATRMVHLEEGGHLMPVIDMARHRNGCPHSIAVKDCTALTPLPDTDDAAPGISSKTRASKKAAAAAAAANSGGAHVSVLNTTRLCLVLTAGSDLAANEEVCLAYGYMLPDRMMLQYGFIPEELLAAVANRHNSDKQHHEQIDAAAAVSVPLFGMDRHDFKVLSSGTELPWRFWLDEHTGPPDFEGTPNEVAAEIARLQQLAEELAAGDAAAAAVQPVEHADADGSVLRKLRLWRELRKLAVAQEIQRLQKLQQQEQV